MEEIKYKIGKHLEFAKLIELYEANGWIAYTHETRRGNLVKAFENSDFVVSAWDKEQLVGLARCLSDDVSIFLLQDILVLPGYQRQGIGRRLLEMCLERYAHVRSKILLTDYEERQKKFYESMGFKNTRNLKKMHINTFVQMIGIELE